MKTLIGTVSGDSMAPLIEKGDSIRLSKRKTYRKGALLRIRLGKDQIIHRLVQQQGNLFFTKGDNSGKADAPSAVSDILGEVTAIYDDQLRTIVLPSKKEALFSVIDAFFFQHTMMKYRKFRWFRYYMLRFLKNILWPAL